MRICIIPEYPASLMTGGLQVQAEQTFRALATLGHGLEAELFNWSDHRPLADLYHFIGFPPHLERVTELLRKAGRPYLITLLFGGNHRPVRLGLARLRRWGKSRVLRRRAREDAILGARALVVITGADARAAQFIYGLKPGRVHVVHNGVSDSFFHATAEEWRREHGSDPFVLSAGAIQPRKGQCLLAEACNRLRRPLVLLGPILPGESAYASEVEAAMKRNAGFGGRWLRHLRNEDALLASAFAACRVFALLSSSETQPLSVMQAMAARRPILLRRAGYTDDPLFRSLPITNAANVETVAADLQQVWDKMPLSSLGSEYTWDTVARRLREIYEQCLEVRSQPASL
jgi:glycosyltransferase involved in cell wall biosynthesis